MLGAFIHRQTVHRNGKRRRVDRGFIAACYFFGGRRSFFKKVKEMKYLIVFVFAFAFSLSYYGNEKRKKQERQDFKKECARRDSALAADKAAIDSNLRAVKRILQELKEDQ